MQPLTLVVSLVVALTWSGATHQSSACSLLTLSEIEVATGAKPGEPHSGAYPMSKTDSVHTCMWAVAAARGQVSLSVGRLPTGLKAEDAANHNPGIDGLRAKNWNEEAKDFTNAWCSIFTPPASEKQTLMMSQCSAQVKDMILSVVFTSPTKKLTIDQAKTLLDAAVAREQ